MASERAKQAATKINHLTIERLGHTFNAEEKAHIADIIDKEMRVKTAEALDIRHQLQQAYQQLRYLWSTTHSCPCGARAESPKTHPHVGGCPTAAAIESEVKHGEA